MRKLPLFSLLLSILIVACTAEKTSTKLSDAIRINQIGFYPNSVKQFVVADLEVTSFDIVNENNEVVFNGEMNPNGVWEASGEKVFLGDFSEFNKEGSYKVQVDKKLYSYPFEIKKGIYEEALNASIKSYYYQRASMPIEEKFGGVYKREAGHPDDNCAFHPSSGRTEGTLNSPGGWYDAGDYGKYIVNAALSTGQMLQLLEQYPNAIADGALNIPESGNGNSDLIDELKYELDWILTMQDEDGGVFHKLTSKNFSGFIMPNEFDLERMIIGKGTAATLDYAAVLALASRLYKSTDEDWSKKALEAAEKAWDWAVKNPAIAYSNPEDVSTGAYDDTVFTDDFYWAATELYLTSKDNEYLDYLIKNEEPFIHELTNSWKFFIRNNAFHSLLENKDLLDVDFVKTLTQGQIKIADNILKAIENNPYNIGLERFEWGSNSDILNQAMVLCMTHRFTGDEKYLVGAEQITDYILGKNATGYSFLTGFGSKKVMNVHHRPSAADGIVDPIPGFIAGGPNNDKQDSAEVEYASEYPAKAFADVVASYASNEVCLNWNAPAVYVLGYLQENRK
ncbi:non-processive endocellulase [Lutibacter agarilyticus]|uniref:Non-processive endocellulase n=1 Tax=Lutibacter agarilyticus TaxID=1109740 RepID=A0A238XWW4_9FLAO|nr:glycoside hydrolase family 9 protein [Lutibacter agarilyticus]SNR63485.1 non-processive endocellulase [Lutibacter agarilyticus]